MAGESTALDFLIVGHVVRDLAPEGDRIGGTAAYAGITARNLGARVGIVTSFGDDFDPRPALAGINLAVVPAAATTTFENIYEDGIRTQRITGTAAPLAIAAVPADWIEAAVVLLGPLVAEIDVDLGFELAPGVIASTAQGWLRRWDETGLVRRRLWPEAFPDGPPTPIVVLSEDDVGRDKPTIEAIAQQTSILVVTRGVAGASLYQFGRQRDFPAFPAREVDPTGAGDVFAGAFVWRLHQTGDPAEAMIYANCAASISIEAVGVDGCPTPEQIERRRREA